MMLTCSGGRSSPRLSRSLLPPHSSPVLGLNAMPTVFRRPRAKIRPPEPSGLNCEIAARSESRSSHKLHDDPTARYSLCDERNRARGMTTTGNVVDDGPGLTRARIEPLHVALLGHEHRVAAERDPKGSTQAARDRLDAVRGAVAIRVRQSHD